MEIENFYSQDHWVETRFTKKVCYIALFTENLRVSSKNEYGGKFEGFLPDYFAFITPNFQ